MKKTTLIILISIFLFLNVQFVQAQCPAGLVPCARDCDSPDTPWDDSQRCTLCHFFVMFDQIVDFIMLTLVPIVAVLMIVIAGAMFMIHQIGGAEVFPTGTRGGPALISQAKRLLTSVVTGLIIVYAAWIIVNTFLVIIGVAGWTGLATGWFSISCPVP